MAEKIAKPAIKIDDLEIDETTRPGTDTNFLLMAVIGVVCTAILMGLAFLCKGSGVYILNFYYMVMLDRGPIQWFSTLFGMMVFAHVLLKGVILKKQRQPLYESIIDADTDLTQDDSISSLRRVLHTNDDFDSSILLRRMDRHLAHWLGSRDVSLVATWSAQESDREFEGASASHVVAQIMLAMIPLLGFIGTVIGLSGAVSGFSNFLGGSTEMTEITGALKRVTGDLGTAFDTTLLALVYSVLLTFPLTIMVRRENEMLIEFDSYIDDKIISKFPPQEPQTIRIENLEDSIDAAFRRYIPDPDRYDEVFSRAIDKAGMAVQEKFAGLIASYEAAMTEMTEKLASHLSSAGESIEVSMRSVVADVQKQDELMVSSRKSIAEAETDRLRGLLDEFHNNSAEVAGLYQQKAEQMQESTEAGLQKTVGAANELAIRVDQINGMAGQIDQLLRLEESVEKSLSGLSQSEEFRATLENLRGHLETTDDFCKKLAKPKVITFKEESI